MKFGICAGPEQIAVLEDAGYDYIEFNVSGNLAPEKPDAEVMPVLESALKGHRIKPEAFNGFLPGDLRVTGPEIDAARQERYCASAFRRAAAIGGHTIVFGSGGARQVPAGFDKAKAHDQIVDFLTRIADSATASGIIIAIEPLNSSECNILNGVAETMEIVDRVNHPAIQVLSDLYHVAYDKQSYSETADAGDHLRHVHVATLVGRKAPLTGDIEFLTDYFRAVKAAGYDSRTSIEGGWDDMPGQAAEALAAMRTAWEAA